ncbi:hypothetical protein C8Q78DRAFT_216301 [Trametes maxima]|nr:hypothetical protein C8Q78DRAFT_216301 [Trametes maxima]
MVGTTVTPESVRALLSAVPLSVLSVHLARGLDTTELTDAPTLLELQCSGTCADIASLVGSIRTPSLASFTSWICDPTTMTLSDFRQLVRGVTSPHSSASLRRLFLCRPNLAEGRHSWVVIGNEPAVASVTDVFAPVFALHGLTNFSVALNPRAFALTCGDDDVLALACGLPTLQGLSLECHFSYPYTTWSPPSVRALQALAAHCPRLTELCIGALNGCEVEEQAGADAGAADGDSEASPILPQRHPLRLLRIQRVEGLIQDPEQFAKLLDGLFPDLETFEWPRGIYLDPTTEHGHVFASWGDVWTKLQELQKDRRGEGASSA